MKLTHLPGTTLSFQEGDDPQKTLDGIFAAGGLVLSQVVSLINIESYTVQNWVKRKFVSPPSAKKYSRSQFCRLVIINLLKDSLNISEITGLLSYINGQLDDESDDTVNDAHLYAYFTETLLLAQRRTPESFEEAAKQVLGDYKEPVEGSKERLLSVLTIMCVAYSSSELHRQARELLFALPTVAEERPL